ncbi:MAG: YqzL family protein [Clostridia bacterium]|nr:YqzL family protein [Clostridia bacterium]
MIKQIAWNTFKNTGDIYTMMELIEVERAMKINQEKELKIEKQNEIVNGELIK